MNNNFTIMTIALLCGVFSVLTVNAQEVDEYQHQYYIYNNAGRSVKVFIHNKEQSGEPFKEKEVKVKRGDTLFLANFMKSDPNIHPREQFNFYIVKWSWFKTKKYEAYLNVERKKVGSDAVNYYIQIMGKKEKAKERFNNN
ncbi:hypothetical protein [Salibacter sp.]|uniref:hypothetical protein n=1 Tax=Salibacter sp. TaxID=2010995 RepID=UPI00287061D5|nr:hypothetical protein [Salibacter sp.]MDR9488373.1 hypothetical protein [Salibacter sp.]